MIEPATIGDWTLLIGALTTVAEPRSSGTALP